MTRKMNALRTTAAGLATASAITLAPAAAYAADPVVTTWRGLPDVSSDMPVYPGSGSGDWFAWAASPYTDANPAAGSPWTAGIPRDADPATFHAVIGASRAGVDPTRTHEVTLWGSSVNLSSVPSIVRISGLTVGTDYVLSVKNPKFPPSGTPRTLVLSPGSTFVNDGVIQLDGVMFNPSQMRLLGPTTLAGRGTIELGRATLSAPGESRPVGQLNGIDVDFTTNSGQVTVGPDQTIVGSGQITGLVRNEGTIRSSYGVSGDPLSHPSNLNVRLGLPSGQEGVTGTAVNTGTLIAENGGRVSVVLNPQAGFRNEGVLEANGKDAANTPSRLVLQRPNGTTTTFQFADGHKPRAVNGGIVEARGWTLNATDIDFVGTGNTLAVADGGTVSNVGGSLDLSSGLSVEIGGGGTLVGGSLDNTAPGSGAIVVAATDGGTATFQDVSVNGTVTVAESATLALAGTVSGTFTATGDVAVQGTLSPGNSPGVVTVTGDAAVGSSAALAMEIAGTAGHLYDQLNISQSLDVAGGTLGITLLDGFTPQEGDTFDLLDFASATGGGFTSLSLPALGDGLAWDTGALYTTGELAVVPEPATLSALALGAGLTLLRRRRR